MKHHPRFCVLVVVSTMLACGSDPNEAALPGGGGAGGSASAGRQGNSGAGGGSNGGAFAGAGGSGGGGTGGGGSGGSFGGGGAGAGGAGNGGALDASAVDGPARDGSIDGDGSGPAPPPAANQGPVAAGTIAYSQDFEGGDMDGLGRSPPSVAESRTTVVDDPLGQRGKVLRIQWLVGDNFRSAPQFRPKTFVSNNSAFNYNSGDRISYAFGYMTESTYIGATLAQNITGGDPIWMIQGRDNGILDIVPGLVRLPIRLEANKWYDFRVDVDYLPGNAGLIEMYVNGEKVYTRRGGLPIGPRAHWDGGIYLTGFGQMGNGNNTPRTVYFSNLSCGRK